MHFTQPKRQQVSGSKVQYTKVNHNMIVCSAEPIRRTQQQLSDCEM